MNISVEVKENNFKPVSLNITFETAEELDSFKAMAQISTSVSLLTQKTSMHRNNNYIKLNGEVLNKTLTHMFHKLPWSKHTLVKKIL